METGNPSNYRDHDGLQIQAKKPSKQQQSKEPFKVRYISSPVMVNAKNASEFKAIVQELTGKDSGDGHHHQRSTPAGEAAARLDHRPGSCGAGAGRNAHASYEVLDDLAHRSSSTIASDGLGDDVFWKLPESLSRYDFPFG